MLSRFNSVRSNGLGGLAEEDVAVEELEAEAEELDSRAEAEELDSRDEAEELDSRDEAEELDSRAEAEELDSRAEAEELDSRDATGGSRLAGSLAAVEFFIDTVI